MAEASASILLIEDDRVDIMTVQRALKKHAIANPLQIARTATDALALLREAPDALPALVLLDLNLPRMSGIDFLRELRQDPQLRDLRVIVLTSSNEPNDRAAAFRYEVEDYIVKPHSFEAFATAVNMVIRDVLAS